MNIELLPEINQYLTDKKSDFGNISQERIQVLQDLALFIGSRIKSGQSARLLFICTQNARRSILTQVLAKAAALYYDLPMVETFSGGTQTTSIYPAVLKVLRETGLRINLKESGNNPVYTIKISKSIQSMGVFSKKYDHKENPKKDFVAVMICAEADKKCPFIPGTSLKISMPYQDPKITDGTPDELTEYRSLTNLVTLEMNQLFSLVKNYL
jgi:arsenate reductase